LLKYIIIHFSRFKIQQVTLIYWMVKPTYKYWTLLNLHWN